MNRRRLIITGVAGAVGLIEYRYVTAWMNGLRNPHNLSVKEFERYGERAAVMAITPNEDFYITSKGGTPSVKASQWQLKIDGLVEHAFSLDYEKLRALPRFEKVLTLECISNSIGGNAISNARWTGTPLRPLLERAQPVPDAAYAVLHAADGFTTGHPVSRLWNEQNAIVYGMNGEDLPPVHGYPARMFIPGKFGMKQPKWITRIEFVKEAHRGYWESQGWSDTCERWAHARFTDLKDGTTVSGQNFEFTGYALGNLDGIKAVEISFDDGTTWQATSLFSNPSALVWTFWRYIWAKPRPGSYKLRLRGIDGKGRVEGYKPREIFPDGATGQQVIRLKVV
jgi:DMSO/TMAO reductase YedYZ molybdopterin-dependent catalytic subunit